MSQTKSTRRRFLQTTVPSLAIPSLGLASTWPSKPLHAQQSESVVTSQESSRVAQGKKGVVATVHPLASAAGIGAFERGGNAIDAAVAASLMLSVVDGFNSGIGGGCLIVVRTASGKIHAIDGREMAPQNAKPEMFYTNGKPDPKKSQVGPLAAGVPGLLAALDRITTTFGKLKWDDSLRGAAEVAESGFELDSNYVGRLSSAAPALKNFAESARILLDDQGRPWSVGHRLMQPDLAGTLHKLANEGIDWFYGGPFAQRVESFMQEQGGMLKASDFERYRTVARQPVETQYRGRTVYGFPPPSSGGIHIAQMLGMLESFPVADVFRRSEAEGKHLLLEVMKRAMADRAYWLGDSDFAKVPRGLLDKGYLKDRASSIDLSAAVPVSSHGQPPRANVDLFGGGGHTTHLTAADAEGNVVAITQTVNTTFGCKMIVPGTGVVLNNELDDFSIAPGVRNAFGLVGSEANLIAPGKRPLSSMSPTIVLNQDGSPRLSCGAAGGPKIITTSLQVVVRCLDLGQSIDAALAAPRCHHQWSPDEAVCEQANGESVFSALRERGHDLKIIRSGAVGQGLEFSNGSMTAASDPRVPSAARAIS